MIEPRDRRMAHCLPDVRREMGWRQYRAGRSRPTRPSVGRCSDVPRSERALNPFCQSVILVVAFS